MSTVKISAAILDIYDDHQGVIARSLPPELHTCKVASVDEVVNLPDHMFGLVAKTADGVLRRRFPLHDEPTRKLSAAYFTHTKHFLPEDAQMFAERKISAALEGRLHKDVAYVDLAKSRTKVADTSERIYGLVVNGRNLFPLHSPLLVKTALERFRSSVETLEPIQRWEYARNLEKRAAALGVDTAGSAIEAYTGDSLNYTTLSKAINQRKAASHGRNVDTEVLRELEQLYGLDLEPGGAESGESYAFRTKRAAALKKAQPDPSYVVGILTAFDRAADISRHQYNRGILDPCAAVYHKSSRRKLAEGPDISGITEGQLSGKFDDDFIARFLERPMQVYQGLPEPVKALLRDLAGQTQRDAPGAPVGDPTQPLNPTYSNGVSSSAVGV
jgi:hypothetical protein